METPLHEDNKREHTFQTGTFKGTGSLFIGTPGEYGLRRFTPKSKEQLGQIIEELQEMYSNWKDEL